MTSSSSASAGLSSRDVDEPLGQVTPKIDSWRRSRNDRLRHSAPPHLTFASSTAARLAASRDAAAKARSRRETEQQQQPTVPTKSTSTAAVARLEVCVDTSRARSNLDVVRLCINELGWKEVRRSSCCMLLRLAKIWKEAYFDDQFSDSLYITFYVTTFTRTR